MQNFFLELVLVFSPNISEQKIRLKCKFVLDWNQGLTKLEFDTEDQVLLFFVKLGLKKLIQENFGSKNFC